MNQQAPVAILHNAISDGSPEDVLDNLRQAQWIGEELQSAGYCIELVPFSLQAILQLANRPPKLRPTVCNLVDSAPGQESLCYLSAGLLEHAGLKYTGCTLEALYTTTNKILTKQLLHSRTIKTPQWVGNTSMTLGVDWLSNPVFLLKPTSEDASIGLDDTALVSVSDETALSEIVMNKQHATGKEYFAERYIDGREFTVCIFEDHDTIHVFDPYEWVFQGYEENHMAKIITYDAKWSEQSFGFSHITAKYDFQPDESILLDRLVEIALECWRFCKLTGYARVDFRIDQKGEPWVLEINGNPSFYGFYHCAKKAGIAFLSVLKSILDAAVSRS